MFGNLIEVTKTRSGSGERTSLMKESKSLSFIEIKEIGKETLPEFLKDLEKLVAKLNDGLIKLYRSGTGW